MSSTAIAINGGGRIGLQVVRHWIRHTTAQSSSVHIALINDPFASAQNLAYSLKWDTVHGQFEYDVAAKDDNTIQVKTRDGSKTFEIALSKETEPEKIPYAKHGVAVVLECTGRFTAEDKAKRHLHDSVQKVLISAPATGEGVFTTVLGVNDQDLSKHKIISNASCTTNCLAPLVSVLHKNFKIQWGTMTTTHAATATQKVVDGLGTKDLANGRSVFNNIIPASTGAAKAIGKVIPELNGKIDGSALRVPVPDVSFCDFVCGVEKATTADEVKKAFAAAAADGPLKGILGTAHDGAVSSDFIGDKHSSIIDPNCTLVLNGKTVKVGAYYDNEYGYSMRLYELAIKVVKK